MLKGKVVERGIAVGKAVILSEKQIVIEDTSATIISEEVALLHQAINQSIIAIEALKNTYKNAGNISETSIFDAHIEMVRDPVILKQVIAKIKAENISAAKAYKSITDKYIKLLAELKDDYFSERAQDVEDIQYRMLSQLTHQPANKKMSFNEPVIIFAKNLTPSDTATLDLTYVKGFVTEHGGITSHTAIIARSLNIPAMVQVEGVLEHVEAGQTVILNAIDGIVDINPTNDAMKKVQLKQETYQKKQAQYQPYLQQPTKTKDNHKIRLLANISSVDALDDLADFGAEGIGLFRTELALSDYIKDENAQEAIYRKLLKSHQDTIIRTWDFGGDKYPHLKPLPNEENPFLGTRGIRLSLIEKALFKIQIRALLKASSNLEYVKILLPMITNTEEIIAVKKHIAAIQNELSESGINYQKHVKLGAMIEVPAAALNAEALAKHLDFFSIGTNDLMQYVYAADRNVSQLDHLQQPLEPFFIRLVKHVVEVAETAKIELSVCGEIASNLKVALVFIGLNIKQLSVNKQDILYLRKHINAFDLKTLQAIAETIITMHTAHEVETYLAEKIGHIG